MFFYMQLVRRYHNYVKAFCTLKTTIFIIIDKKVFIAFVYKIMIIVLIVLGFIVAALKYLYHWFLILLGLFDHNSMRSDLNCGKKYYDRTYNLIIAPVNSYLILFSYFIFFFYSYKNFCFMSSILSFGFSFINQCLQYLFIQQYLLILSLFLCLKILSFFIFLMLLVDF